MTESEPNIDGPIENFVKVGNFSDFQENQCKAMNVGGKRLLFIKDKDQVFVLDNRCPHMGFPLDKGTLKNGILTCHWHHARFDICGGGAFDIWADDVDIYPIKMVDQEVWVNPNPKKDVIKHYTARLKLGLEQNLSLLISKSVIELLANGVDPLIPFRIGIEFGTKYRGNGWGSGLTILTAMMNIFYDVKEEDKPLALYHGLIAVASDSSNRSPKFQIGSLPEGETDILKIKTWFRDFVDVFNGDGSERCLSSAIDIGASRDEIADMLFTAATDHHFMDEGHLIDFINKALEAADLLNWQNSKLILSSLIPIFVNASRAEDSSAWRTPINLLELTDTAFLKLGDAVRKGRLKIGSWTQHRRLVDVLMDDNPSLIVDIMLQALEDGIEMIELARIIAYASALRIAHFHTVNEFGDWDNVHHAFTYANATYLAMVRAPSVDLLRAVFDGAMFNYLNRFLNIPSAPLPKISNSNHVNPEKFEDELLDLLNRQQQVNRSATLVASHLQSSEDSKLVLAGLGSGLLREDRSFHSLQIIEAAFRQHKLANDKEEGINFLVAGARFLAAHSPSRRAQGQTYKIATKLFRREEIYETG
ncbi:MAG: Rieske 2Fe-2S domain-containing protein [Candidatus Heimdallarchaeota archaeon]|nr:Rieske 2Fe-2S domain-containing protein [Candidatus Heimdallarchaeota archaeon]